VVGDLKQVKISSLRSIMVACLPLEYIVKALVATPITVLNHSKHTHNDEDMGLKLKKSV
jgi:hypothetical protein